MLEIKCPDSCSYLAAARDLGPQREKQLQQKVQAATGNVSARPTEKQFYLLFAAQTAIVRIRREKYKSLTDKDVIEAIDNSKNNLETAGSGIIYEHTHDLRLIQELSLAMRKEIEDLVNAVRPETRPSNSDKIKALEALKAFAEGHIKGSEDPADFIRYMALMVPWEEPAGDSLVIPGSGGQLLVK